MGAIEWIMGSAIIVMAVFLVIAVLMQSGKDKSLSGTIVGSADTYYGKSKGQTRDRILARLTAVVAVIFGALVVAMYVIVSKGV